MNPARGGGITSTLGAGGGTSISIAIPALALGPASAVAALNTTLANNNLLLIAAAPVS
jgi:hypothetical protein